MKTSVSVVCYKYKVLANGESPLMLRISKDGRRTMKSLGVSVHTKFWNFDTNQPKPNCPNRQLIRQIMLKYETEYNGKILTKEINEEEFTPQTIVAEQTERIKAQTVDEVYKMTISELKERGNVGNAYAYLNSYNVLKSFNRNKPLHFTFSRIDVEYLEAFENWMRKRGNKDTSMSFQMRTLRAVFNRAIKMKAIAREKNPFTEYKISRFNTRTPKRALNKTEIMKIIEVDCSAENVLCQLARDVFVFSYLCGGISFVDIANLTPGNIVDGRLVYTRQKTHGAINIPLSEQAIRIIVSYTDYCQTAGYLFPILDICKHTTPQQKRNRIHKVCHQINTELRQLARKLNITGEVTTYVARHSFATVLKKSGVNIGIISEALGHQNLKTTQIYLDSFENSQIDEAMRNLL